MFNYSRVTRPSSLPQLELGEERKSSPDHLRIDRAVNSNMAKKEREK